LTSSPNFVVTTAIASDRPFHALSYPDINYTVMRPASLPPSASTYNPQWPVGQPSAIGLTGSGWTVTPAEITATPPAPPYVQYTNANSPISQGLAMDPGQRNPYFFIQPGTAQPPYNTTPYNLAGPPPSIPAQRLFQIPDKRNTTNAGDSGDSKVNLQTPIAINAGTLASPIPVYLLANPDGDLALQNLADTDLSGNPEYPYAPNSAINFALGADGTNDRRQHPYFRTEWLQKVMNLTTVRTHQFAVWITVGFFEVTRQGDPLMVNDPNFYSLAYDQLGMELNVQSGRNIRYRSFFILDRTKATGFNPGAPGDFRNVVIYRQTIE
jgi:hypothetical protein